jgi:hypothetical protein
MYGLTADQLANISMPAFGLGYVIGAALVGTLWGISAWQKHRQ